MHQSYGFIVTSVISYLRNSAGSHDDSLNIGLLTMGETVNSDDYNLNEWHLHSQWSIECCIPGWHVHVTVSHVYHRRYPGKFLCKNFITFAFTFANPITFSKTATWWRCFIIALILISLIWFSKVSIQEVIIVRYSIVSLFDPWKFDSEVLLDGSTWCASHN